MKKKQPKPTYTKVKVLNKPRGPIATAIKTLKHPLKSTHASKDTDVIVTRVYGGEKCTTNDSVFDILSMLPDQNVHDAGSY